MSHSTACLDWERRLVAGESLIAFAPPFPSEGDRAVAVFNKLRLADVTGTPTLADAGGEWFREIVRALFGSLDPETQERAIREVFLLVPKKSNKTTGGALLMLTALMLNRRPNAEFFFVAPVQDTAEIAFSAAAGAIALDPVLTKKLHVREHLKKIVHRESGAELSILTFDPAVLTGQKCSGGVLIDELHVVAKMSKAASAIRQLRGGMLPFPEAFMVFITTQSEEAPSGVFKAELLKARAIRDGDRTGATLPVLYEFPRKMQADASVWRNPKNWHMVTPNAGRSVTIARLEEEFDVAQATSEEELRSWASQHLNVEIGLALHSDRWAGADFWEQQGREEVTFEAIIKRCEVVTVGIDGGGLDDLLGLAVCGRDAETGEWLTWFHAWAHSSVLERRKSEAPKLRDFEADGDLTISARLHDAIGELARIVARVDAAGVMPQEKAIGIDPEKTHKVVCEALLEAGIDEAKIIGISQGWRLCGAITVAEGKLSDGVLIHGARPFMAWIVGNAKVEPKGNAILITKQASGTAKIDPLMAGFCSWQLMALNPEASGNLDEALANPIIA